jgi:HPt (histidine-containing phosphotransfer) domain-containing protein
MTAAPVWSPTPELREIADIDSGMMPELLSLFLDDSAVRLKALSGACTQRDFRIVHAQAHSLKGSALQMGAAGLASLCAELELSDRPGPEQCGAMMRAIDNEFILVRRAMEEYLVSGQTAELHPFAQDAT